MRAAGTPPLHLAGRGQDGDLQLHRGVVQSRSSPFWHPLPIPNRLRDADAQANPNDLSDEPSTKPGQLHGGVVFCLGSHNQGRTTFLLKLEEPSFYEVSSNALSRRINGASVLIC